MTVKTLGGTSTHPFDLIRELGEITIDNYIQSVIRYYKSMQIDKISVNVCTIIATITRGNVLINASRRITSAMQLSGPEVVNSSLSCTFANRKHRTCVCLNVDIGKYRNFRIHKSPYYTENCFKRHAKSTSKSS